MSLGSFHLLFTSEDLAIKRRIFAGIYPTSWSSSLSFGDPSSEELDPEQEECVSPDSSSEEFSETLGDRLLFLFFPFCFRRAGDFPEYPGCSLSPASMKLF